MELWKWMHAKIGSSSIEPLPLIIELVFLRPQKKPWSQIIIDNDFTIVDNTITTSLFLLPLLLLFLVLRLCLPFNGLDSRLRQAMSFATGCEVS